MNSETVSETSLLSNEVSYTEAISDSTTGLTYMNARYYNSAIGSFTSQDTYLGSAYNPQSQHLYSYTGGNPINYVDPIGHYFVKGASFGESTGEHRTINDAIYLEKARQNRLDKFRRAIVNYKYTHSKKTGVNGRDFVVESSDGSLVYPIWGSLMEYTNSETSEDGLINIYGENTTDTKFDSGTSAGVYLHIPDVCKVDFAPIGDEIAVTATVYPDSNEDRAYFLKANLTHSDGFNIEIIGGKTINDRTDYIGAGIDGNVILAFVIAYVTGGAVVPAFE